MTSRTPGEGRYAHVEREQRWVLADLPADVHTPSAIVDRYVTGTRLRLRRVETDGQVVHKLAQKVRPQPADPETVRLTNLYLSPEEHAVLAVLAAAELRKTRWRTAWADRALAIDQFEGHLAGLVLAEVELGVDEDRLPVPPFALADVTDDDRFSGGSLAAATPAQVAALLAHRTRPF